MTGTPIGKTYGLTAEFLSSIGIDGPLHKKLHVTNVSQISCRQGSAMMMGGHWNFKLNFRKDFCTYFKQTMQK